MIGKRLFVTVGTTEFNKLIEIVSSEDTLELIHKLGYDTVQFQTGQGELTERNHPKVKLLYTPYFEDFSEQIGKSDLIVSHAGAGTCLEVLRKRKPLIVVVNEELMDNHQTELAEQLDKSNYIYYSTVNNLTQVLKEKEISKLKPYPIPDVELFSNYLDQCVGFIKKEQE